MNVMNGVNLLVCLVCVAVLCSCGDLRILPSIETQTHTHTFEGTPASETKMGSHVLTVVDKPGKKRPSGGTSGLLQKSDGYKIYFYESADGTYRIELENEHLTVNDVQYTLDEPSMDIRIVGDQVMVNGEEIQPDSE